MKGSEKHAPTIRTKRSRSAGASPIPAIRKTTSVFRVFSLQAPWHWVTISAHKPRWEWCVDAGVSIGSLEERRKLESLRGVLSYGSGGTQRPGSPATPVLSCWGGSESEDAVEIPPRRGIHPRVPVTIMESRMAGLPAVEQVF